MVKKCVQCSSELTTWQKKFCSNKCQADFQYGLYIKNWKNGKVNGERGVKAKNISRHLKRYLIEEHRERCSICGWRKRNKFTGSIPLEIDHIDGNSENNTEKNLRLLCPNCHSLTKNFRNLNYGKGRKWRKKKYVKERNPD